MITPLSCQGDGPAGAMTAVDSHSPEKILFASTTQAFLQKEAPLRRVRELHAAGVASDAAKWRRAAEPGWTGLPVPEELGGGSVSGSALLIWRWSPNYWAKPWPPDRCIRSAPC